MKTITCPNCQHPIDIDQVLAHQVEESVRADYQKKEAALEKTLQDQQTKLVQLQKSNEEEKKKLLSEQEQKLKRELWEKAQLEAQKRADEASSVKLKELEQRAAEESKRAKEAEAAQLELLKRQRELEQEKSQFQLKVERELDQRLKLEAEKISKLESERFSIKEKELQKQIEDMKTLAEEARRKGSTVSQQLQGEVLELELEKMLRAEFPDDVISEVKKGQVGADLLQTVKNQFGKTIGTIVWESKQTEHFSDKWLPKLREDCRAVHGSAAVLVSRTLPDHIKTCGEYERVWVTGMEFVLPLAHLLRQTLLKVDQEKAAQNGKDIKAEMLYQYINSQEFRGRVEAIVESFSEMKDDLEKEQRALQNSWKKREKQLLRLATNTAYMYGEMQGLVGSSLPTINGLELEIGETRTKLGDGALRDGDTTQEELF